jgi:hypothetical protein
MAKKLKFNGFPEPHPTPNHYRGPKGEWKKGDIKELEDKEAESLLQDFPDVFVATK